MNGVRVTVRFCYVALLILIVVDQRAAQKGALQDYCQWESFNATCGHNEVIVMDTARYGRMAAGRCVSKEYGYVGCSQDVVDYMDSECSGRRHCTVPVTEFLKEQVRPCPKDVTSYFEASYRCVKVFHEDPRQCHMGGRRMLLNASEGYISSSTPMSTSTSMASCPWVIQLAPGQRINITLLDFGVYGLKKSSPSSQSVYCNRYAQIRDEKQNTPICAGRHRHKNVYVSKGSRVEITLLRPDRNQEQSHFLLKYQASGCPKLTAPKGGTIRLVDDTATISCNNTKETWFLRCRGSSWVGRSGNCTSAKASRRRAEGSSSGVWSSIFGREWSSSHGILIVIGLGVGLGIIIGVILLLVALICLKRRGWAFGCDGETAEDKSIDLRVPEQSQYGTAPKGSYIHSADSLLQEHTLGRGGGNVGYDPRATSWVTGSNFGTVPGADKSRGMVSRLSEGSLGHIYESPDFNPRDVYNMVGREPS